MTISDQVSSSFIVALELAAAGREDDAVNVLSVDGPPSSSICLEHEDQFKYEVDDKGLPYTTMRRNYRLSYLGNAATSWWEEYDGNYGSMGAGWFIEVNDQDSPPDGLTDIFTALSINIPSADVPFPE